MSSYNSIGIATITSRGIKFNNLNYSCSRAISEQWYEHAQKYGETQIMVFYNITDLSKIWIRLVNSVYEIDEIEIADLMVREEISDLKLEKYFESIQKLKSLRNTKRKVESNE
ncbi:Mu transposase C-terminal domain-containing protein [Paenibacillus thalictri]|uniref:Transposase-like Mu C-terminal domain-containing protein n=1 Tax=Paenibacillus thalictri TaxID=2527873 RepID=A0A4Q9DFA3_9BACL|nr:Mu transposase C-terminal domain-containing protein [Paenibacillus thalictri]TBL68366.1 hypothetical protein EYB31_38285 [Paenibacillus thalictri]